MSVFGLDPQAKERDFQVDSGSNCPADFWVGTSVFFSRLFVISLVVFVGLMASVWFDWDDLWVAVMYLVTGAFAVGFVYFVGWCIWKYIRFRLSLPKIQVKNLYFTDVRCEDGCGITAYCRMDAGLGEFVWPMRAAVRVKDSSLSRDRAVSLLTALLPDKSGDRFFLPSYGAMGLLFRKKCGFLRMDEMVQERPELKDRFAVSLTDVRLR